MALIFLGSDPNLQVVTMRLANIVGDRGQDWHLLTAGAFLTMILPLAVFFSLATLLRARHDGRFGQGLSNLSYDRMHWPAQAELDWRNPEL